MPTEAIAHPNAEERACDTMVLGIAARHAAHSACLERLRETRCAAPNVKYMSAELMLATWSADWFARIATTPRASRHGCHSTSGLAARELS